LVEATCRRHGIGDTVKNRTFRDSRTPRLANHYPARIARRAVSPRGLRWTYRFPRNVARRTSPTPGMPILRPTI